MNYPFYYLLCCLAFVSCTNSSSGDHSQASPADQKSSDAQLIADYAKDQGLNGQTTASGIYYVIVKHGDGPSAKDLTTSSSVTAHYHGTFLDGKVFDSSVNKSKPFNFKLGQVIPGWQEAIRMLHVGGKGIFIIPSHLAYGSRGYPGLIPPNTVLRFEVELLEI